MYFQQVFFLTIFFLPTQLSFAAGSGGGHLNFYQEILEALSLDSRWQPFLASGIVFVVLLLIGLIYKKSVSYSLVKDESPGGKVGLTMFVELAMDFLYGLAKENCGRKFLSFLPFLSALFFFILLNNLSGLIPGCPPATENFSTNLALGVVVFCVYNIAGVQEHGIYYVRQFMGPVLLIAPLFICLELISHSVRPLSLAFRLLANIFGDHLVLSVFSGVVPLGVPALLMFFGLLVACVQTFVFTMLTSIYLNMAMSHDH